MIIKLIIQFLLFSTLCFSQTAIPDGLKLVEYNASYNPILGLETSPDEKLLCVSSYGGRFYMVNIENKISKSAFDQGEKLLWKINLAGFKNGAKPIFSADGKYVILKHVYNKEYITKYKSTECVVVESATGKIVLERKNGVLSAAFANSNTLIIATDENLEWIDLSTLKIIRTIEMPEAEAIATNKSGTIMAVSYIPTKAEFANLKSIDNRKRELKIAKKNKRLIEFFSLPDMQTISIVEDELDIVFRMKFADDDKYLFFLSRPRTNRNSKDDQRQESSASTLAAIHIMRIDPQTGVLDRKFYYRTNWTNADFGLNSDKNKFGVANTMMINNSFFGFKMGLELYDYNNQDKLEASMATKFRLFKKNALPYPFAFLKNSTLAYIGINQNLYLWDYNKLKNHTFNSLNTDDDMVIESASNQIDSLIKMEDFKKTSANLKLSGIYSYDITLIKKGQVLTVFSVSDEATDIKSYNFLLNYLKTLKFENIKIEKDKRIKFKYDFNFEE